VPFVRPRIVCLHAFALVLAAAPSAGAQQGASADLRATPGGGRLAELTPRAQVERGQAKDGWREVTLTGWVRASALRQTGGGGAYPFTVAGEQELRIEPDGSAVATLGGGMVVAQVERRGDWARIRRSGWVREPGAATTAASATPPAPNPAPPASAQKPAARSAPPSPSTPSPSIAAAPRPAPPRPAPTKTGAAPANASAAPAAAVAPPRARPAAPARTAARPATPVVPPARKPPLTIRAAPGGGMVAVVEPDAPVQVLAREGEWTRVRVEGWTRTPVAGAAPGAAAAATLAAMRADPDAFKGREVDWTMRFVSLQMADAVRTDFTPGEWFILARDPNGETGFVYVALTPEQVSAARRLAPFQTFRIAARVRIARSPLMGHPIVDLLRLR
jgi:hypothetical protein